jgi:hypothetical protein
LRNWMDMMPTDLSMPAGFRTAPIEVDTNARNCWGRHPMSLALRIAWAANFGEPPLRKTFAPDACKVMICESTVASVSS